MSVGFDITANTQSAKTALKQLQDAFRQLQQEGKKFTEIDLNDIGAGALNDDLKKILENWRRMTDPRLGGKLAERLQRSGQQDKAPWEIDLRQANPNANDAQIKRLERELIESLLHGISGTNPDLLRLSDPTRTPTGESAREIERRKRQESSAEQREQRDQQRVQQRLEREKAEEAAESERRRQLIMGGVGGAMKFTAGMVGIQTGMQAVQAAYQGANDIGRYTDEFMRRTHDVGNGFDFLRDQVIAAGKGLGVASDEAAKLTLAFTRTAHAATIEEARAGTQAAVGLAAGFGMDKEQAVQQMARLSLIGANGSGELSTKDKKFALKIGQTVGQHNLPLEKGLSDFSRLAETAAAHSTKEPATDNLLGYLRSLYDVAHTTRTGLKGEGGMSLLAQADEGMRRADDPATNLMMFQGLSKIMGTENFLKIQRQKEEGAFAPVLNKEGQDSGQTNFSVLLEQMRKQYQHLDPLAVATVLSERLGLGGIKRGEALIEIEDTYRKQGRGGIGGYEKELADRNIRLDTLNESGIKDIGDILKQVDPAERFKIANSKLNTDFAIPLKDEERKRLEGLRNEASGGDPEKQKAFIDAMIQTSAEHGMKATPYSTTEKTLAEIHSALIDTLGKTLTDISGSVSAIAQKYLGETPEQAAARKDYAQAQIESRDTAVQATEELAKAQAAVDNAKNPEEKAVAIKKRDEIYQQQQEQLNEAQKKKKETYIKQRGWFQKGIDEILGPWIPDMKMDNPLGLFEKTKPGESLLGNLGKPHYLGMATSPDEKKAADLNPPSLQDEINRLKAQLDDLNPSVLSGAWWTDSWEEKEQKAERYRTEGPKIQQQIDALEAQKSAAPVRRASGGIIPGGVGGGDRVPALLTPGEFVINASATQKHLPLLHQINQGDGPVRFAQGGQVPGGFSPAGAEMGQDSNDATPTTVRELQKRLEQLFDPVTRYLSELAAGARALKNQPGKSGTAIPGVPGGSVATAADGTPIMPIAHTTPVEETQPLLRAALARGAYPSVTPSTVHQSTGTVFPGDGRGFLSPGSGTTTARKMREGRPDFVGPPTPDADASPSIRAAQEGSTGGAGGTGTATATPTAKAAREGSANDGDPAEQMIKAIMTAETGDSGALTDEKRFIRTRVTPEKNKGRTSSAYGPVQITKGYWDSFKSRQYQNLPPDEQAHLDKLIKQGQQFIGNDKSGNLYDKTYGYGGKGTLGQSEEDRKLYATLAKKSIVDLAKQHKTYSSFIKSFRGEDEQKYFNKIAKSLGKDPEQVFKEMRHMDVKSMGKYSAENKAPTPLPPPAAEPKAGQPDEDYTPKPLNDSPYTPKPKEPIPEPRTDSASADGAAGGVGHLNITLTQADSRGAKIGHEVNHQMNLRTPRPTGRITVAAANGVA